MSIEVEINKRKTFAIISHPDAGKTTLTEKLLLYGGAIQTAGAVKSNKIKTATASDFMEIEKQRGISVATAVMGFEYGGFKVNLLDTPGHKDFSEDTYRTLTAVDSVILVVDSVKGVEEQTRSLMKVCRMRKTPVMVFVNKLDRPGKDPFDLMEEIESELDIKLTPLSWPVGNGSDFKGVINLYENSFRFFTADKQSVEKEVMEFKDFSDPKLTEVLGKEAKNLREDAEMAKGVYDDFDREQYLAGDQAPVMFGSALNNFGVKELLDLFVKIAPGPTPKESTVGMVDPGSAKFSGFVFKIHANLDPKHRDRIAFLRVCSGVFKRNEFFHHVRLKKKIRFSNPYSFLGSEKEVTEDALPGDVIGLYDSGNFKIGDTLTEGETMFFKGIPSFSPEIFREAVNANPLKTKQLEKGLEQLTDEGVAQLFTKQPGNRKIIGAVGDLQFEVIKFRLQHEYGADCTFHNVPVHKACWVSAENPKDLQDFLRRKDSAIAYDKFENPVYLAPSAYELRAVMDYNKNVVFNFYSEQLISEE